MYLNASGGELHQYCVADKEDGFCERDVVRLLHQIIEGVHYLHKQNIAHLDLKPQNILLTSKEVGSGDIKLIDFGIARYLSKEEEIRDIQGTPDYVAPEILNYEPITLATDMWSVGVLTYVMLTGNSPFAGDTKQETFLNISQVNLEFPEEDFGSLSAEAQDFIQSLCIKEPEKRLSAAECFEHPWVRKFTEVEELERERTGTNENLQHQDENSNTSQVSSLTVELVIREDKDTATITKLKDDENENYLENNVARFVSAKELEVSDTRTAKPAATQGNGGGMSRDDSISDMDVHMECDIKDGHEIFVSQEVKVVSLEAVQPLQRSTTEGRVSLNTAEKPVPVAVPVQNHTNHSTENFSISPALSEAGLLGDRACQRGDRSHTDLQVVSLDRGHSPCSSPLGTRRGICPSKENLPSGMSEPKRFCLEVPGQQPGQVVC
ncbi:uncharacterized protein [Diadema antillarum]|uniref:uncharacterized protein n=1 Tax=Diadema antillarum TaxID=105358 RepID=UPI003A843625